VRLPTRGGAARRFRVPLRIGYLASSALPILWKEYRLSKILDNLI
jgi:hypothetical protein